MSDNRQTTDAFSRAADPPEPKPKSYARQKIEELESQKHYPKLEPHLHPPGTDGPGTLTPEQIRENQALSNLIAYWARQDKAPPELHGKARDIFNKAKDGMGR